MSDRPNTGTVVVEGIITLLGYALWLLLRPRPATGAVPNPETLPDPTPWNELPVFVCDKPLSDAGHQAYVAAIAQDRDTLISAMNAMADRLAATADGDEAETRTRAGIIVRLIRDATVVNPRLGLDVAHAAQFRSQRDTLFV